MIFLTLSSLFLLIPTSLCPPVTTNTSSSLSQDTDLDNSCGYGILVQPSVQSSWPYPSCVCVKPYINQDDKKCSYKGKSKLAAFLLSLLLGFLGVDWFYLSAGDAGYIIAGIFKIITWVFINHHPHQSTLAGLFWIWLLVDWIRVLTDSFPDGNGMELFGNF
jgi:hypothetical protein